MESEEDCVEAGFSSFAERCTKRERRDRIRSDPALEKEREEELIEIRTQIQIIDSKWSRCRQRAKLDVRQRPLITNDEWRKLRVAKTIEDDWDLRNEKGPSGQWHALESIGCLQETGPQRPAPGSADEGSDEDAFKLDDYLIGGGTWRFQFQYFHQERNQPHHTM